MSVFVVLKKNYVYDDEYYRARGMTLENKKYYGTRPEAEAAMALLDEQCRKDYRIEYFDNDDLGVDPDADLYELTWADAPNYSFHQIVELSEP